MMSTRALRALRVVLEQVQHHVDATSWGATALAWPCSPASRQHAAASLHQCMGLRTITDIHASREESSTAVFDGALKGRHRDRAAYTARLELAQGDFGTQQQRQQQQEAAQPGHAHNRHGYRNDPLLGGITDSLLDRLEDCKSRDFPHALVVGGAALHVMDRLAGGRAGVKRVTVVDTSPDMLRLLQDMAQDQAAQGPKPWPELDVQLMDAEQEMLPVEPGNYDLVISSLGLHWVNDLPTFLAQCRFALRDDGLFLGAMFAGDTLEELRIACSVAQMERQGGVSPVVSPFAQVRDGGNLLTRAGLGLPAVDMDRFLVRYPGGPTDLISHLRSMGEVNSVLQRQAVLGRDTALAAGAVYQAMFGDPENGSVPATYQVMFLTGWAPHESQQKPAKRGSATVSFQELADGLVSTGAAQGGSTGEGGDDEPDSGVCPAGRQPGKKT